MEFSVRKRIKTILENTQRVQELAGIEPNYTVSDPEAGFVAPPNAYEDTFEGLKKRFGQTIISKLEIFLEGQISEQLVLTKLDGTDLIFKKSPSPNTSPSMNGNIQKASEIFVRFGGYMSDTKSYVFNVGYKSKLGEDIFAYRFTMDLEGKMNGWQNVNSGM